jgi:hypothetical protein
MIARGHADSPSPAKELRHYVYLTDGTRFALLRQATWDQDDICLTDPNDPKAGKISWHSSGDLNLGQPTYRPQKVVVEGAPPSAVHGYASPLHSKINTHGLEGILSRPEKYNPTPARPSTFIDLRTQPPQARFLAVEIGVRCGFECHAGASLPTGDGLVQNLIPNGNRFLVISAWWEPLIVLSRKQFAAYLKRYGITDLPWDDETTGAPPA